MPQDDLPEPPPPPEISRRVRLYVFQWIGLGLLGLLPLLALTGVFGVSGRQAEVRGAGLTILTRFPSRLRYNQPGRIEIEVHNRSSRALDSVVIELDSALGNRFGDLRAVPELERPYRLRLDPLSPSASRAAFIELRAQRHGHHRGDLVVTAPAETLRIPLRIRVFP